MNFYEQEKIHDIKQQKLIEQNGKCAHCGKTFKPTDVVELAHIIPQRRWVIDLYGKDIIHHQMNMKATHSGRCNSRVQISPNKTELVEAHVEAIRRKLDS